MNRGISLMLENTRGLRLVFTAAGQSSGRSSCIGVHAATPHLSNSMHPFPPSSICYFSLRINTALMKAGAA